MKSRIPRRDFLNGALLSAGALCTAGLTPMELFARAQARGAAGAQPQWGGNTSEVFTAGHAVRDGLYDDAKIASQETGEVFDLVIIGGGLSGLGAAHFFNQGRERRGKVLVIENHSVVGGNARRDEFVVRGKTLYAPQASIAHQDLPPAFAPPTAVGDLLRDINIDLDRFRIPQGAAGFSVFWEPKTEGAKPGWYASVMDAPLPDRVRQEFMAFIGTVMPFYSKPDWRAEIKRLDRFSFKEYVEREQRWTSGLFELMWPDLAVFFSFPDQVSAAAVYAQYGGGPRPLYYFPGGNSGVLRHLLKRLIPDSISGEGPDAIINGKVNRQALDDRHNPVRIRLGATAVRVEHEGSPQEAKLVRVTYSSRGKLYRLRARAVIMAGGGYITRRVVRDLPEEKLRAYERLKYAPILQINVALNTSRALDRAGLNAFASYRDGFGVVMYLYENMSSAEANPERGPGRPNVIGLTAPLLYPGLSAQEQATKGRMDMLNTSFQGYERRTRAELARLLGPWGFDPGKDIAAIAISRWGHHGYVFPYPGIYTDGAVEAAKKVHGRIAFAHTDLDRFSHLMGALSNGYRAAQELRERNL